MTLFTVHIPVEARDPQEIADRIRVIPEKASLPAFLLGPIWLVAQGAWLAVGVWVVAMTVLVGAVLVLGIAPPGLAAVVLLIQVFIGVEGHQMVRVAASRGRFKCVDVVNARDAEEAQSEALRRLLAAQQPARPAAPIYRPANDLPGIGLFPGAGG
jgi:hypothetical protein